MMKASTAACALLFAAVTLSAHRIEYSVSSNGVRKPGAEVCFFGGDSADDAWSLFFAYSKRGCLAADEVIDMPPGLFHFYARHVDGFVSEARLFSVYRGPAAPEAGYSLVSVPVVSAGVVDLSSVAGQVKIGQSVGIWVAPTGHSFGTFRPLMPGETTIFVAAMNPSVVLLVDNGRPVRVGEPFTLREGEHIRVPPFSDVGNDADVIVPIHSHSVLARRVTHDLEEPRLVLSVAGRRFLPMFEIALPLAASETLAIFKAVPAGRATLSISGEFWMPQALMFDIPVRGTVTLDESIAIDPAAIVEVVFSHSVEQARTKKNGVGQSIRVRLMRCDGSYDCVETAEQEHFGEGSVRFFGVPLGTYHVEARSGDGSTVGADTACTNPGDLTALHFELP